MRRIVPRILLLVVAVLLSLGIAEVFVRLSGYRPLADYRSRLGRRVIEAPAFAIPYLYEPHGSFSEHWPGNPRGYFDPISNGVFYRINAAGFRGDDWSEDGDGRMRIALLGDSLCFGNGVYDRHHFGNQLQSRLNRSHYLGREVEVLNFGLGNFDTIGEAALLRLRVLAFHPEVCLILYYPNDLRDIGGRNGAELMGKRRTLGALRDRLYLADFVLRPLDARVQEHQYVEEIVAAHRDGAPGVGLFRAALRDIAAACRERGAVPMLAVHPVLMRLDASYPFQGAHAFVMKEAASAGLVAYDLLPAFVGQDATALWVHPLDPHPNEIAHGIVAAALFELFREQKRAGMFAGEKP